MKDSYNNVILSAKNITPRDIRAIKHTLPRVIKLDQERQRYSDQEDKVRNDFFSGKRKDIGKVREEVNTLIAKQREIEKKIKELK